MNAHQHVITKLYDCYQNAVNDGYYDDMAQIIICMDAHQRVITDYNQCECLAISVYVWQCRVLSMYASTYKANSSFFFLLFYYSNYSYCIFSAQINH